MSTAPSPGVTAGVLPRQTALARTLKGLPTVRLEEVRKPVFAFAGLADLALEQVKEAPAAYSAEVRKAQERLAEVPAVVKTLPGRVEELRDEASTRVAQATEQAGVLYTSLALRGERLVTSIRRQPATEAALAEGREAVRQAQQAVAAVETSVEEGLEQASSRAQASAVAAKKSARAGRKAAGAAADTLG